MMPITYSAAAFKFGNNIQSTFNAIYKPVNSQDEINQFNALISAFNVTKLGVGATSYHGSYSQVEFDPIPNITRSHPEIPRCELADVLFVSYTPTELRITFLQAKSKKNFTPYPLWLGNVEQYALLGSRPLIKSWVGSVVWNSDILKNAALPSIGSFGVFYKNLHNTVCFDYASADTLKSSSLLSSGSKYIQGTFEKQTSACNYRGFGNLIEVVNCSSISEFGAAIFSMVIGSPIHYIPKKDSPSLDYYNYSLMARTALAKLINTEIRTRRNNNPIFQDLLNSPHFEDIRNSSTSEYDSSIKGIVVVKGASNSIIIE